MEDLCSDEEMKKLKRQVGSFTVRGITGTDELETLQVQLVYDKELISLLQNKVELARPYSFMTACKPIATLPKRQFCP